MKIYPPYRRTRWTLFFLMVAFYGGAALTAQAITPAMESTSAVEPVEFIHIALMFAATLCLFGLFSVFAAIELASIFGLATGQRQRPDHGGSHYIGRSSGGDRADGGKARMSRVAMAAAFALPRRRADPSSGA